MNKEDELMFWKYRSAVMAQLVVQRGKRLVWLLSLVASTFGVLTGGLLVIPVAMLSAWLLCSILSWQSTMEVQRVTGLSQEEQLHAWERYEPAFSTEDALLKR